MCAMVQSSSAVKGFWASWNTVMTAVAMLLKKVFNFYILLCEEKILK
jgi:hypothetical protein